MESPGGSGDKDDDSDNRSPRSPRFQNPDSLGRSPDTFVTFEKLMEAQKEFENMVLAHEMATDDSFKIEQAAATPETLEAQIEKQVRETMRRAYWDILKENLSKTPPDYSQAVSLIGEIKEYLFKLVRQEKVRTEISEILDLDLVQQKIQHDAFDMSYYADYVINRMASLCAPIRDEEIQRLRDLKDPIELFQNLFRVLELMLMDMANFTITQIRPYIKQQAVTYESEKFQQVLKKQAEAGIDGLVRTKAWIARAVSALPPESLTPSQIVCQAFLSVIDWLQEPGEFPETLLMDSKRLLKLRLSLEKLHLICTSIFIAQGVFGPRIAHNPEFKSRLKLTLQVLTEPLGHENLRNVRQAIADQLVKDVETFLNPVKVNEKERKLLESQLNDLPHNQVSILLHKRLTTFLKENLESQHTQPIHLPAGFSAVCQELTQCTGVLVKLSAHNRAVFGAIYDSLIADILPK